MSGRLFRKTPRAFWRYTPITWRARRSRLTMKCRPRNAKGSGLGRKLYTELEEALKAQGILNLYACIGVPEEPDEYLDFNSEQFHAHLGYTTVGTFHKCGYKFGRWYNMIWMEKMIGEHT